MNEKTFRALEYYKIIDELSDSANSGITKAYIKELKPETEIYRVRELLEETREAISLIIHKGALPLGNFYDIASSISMARKGGTLSMKQLLEILYNLRVARESKNFLNDDVPKMPIIKEMAELLAEHGRLENNIDRCIISEDEMSDNASPELRQLRRSIVRQNDAIKAKLNHIIGSSDNKILLQDAIVTMRQGRYVIPVKQEHRGRVNGIIHDRSATGATVFIEPQAIVNLNNELRELELAEEKEVQRILGELSGNVAEYHKTITNNQKLLFELDLIFARAKLSLKYGSGEISINEEGVVDLKKARHPLLDPKKVVPVDIAIGRGYKTLVITGPNTGGKTVSLKTAGLISMMVQTGIQPPVAHGSTVPIFKNIYADIGDEQSIEQSLSTFSSHMSNIVNIVDKADSETLVLTDELGAGTDPTEGAALAISILETLLEKGSTTIGTTHYNELKKYAIERVGVQNASMEFDVNTLSPTYKLIIGVAGKSNAFEISEKLGLKADIIDRARNLIEKGDIEFENLLASIEDDKKKAEQERMEAIAISAEIKAQRAELEKKLKALEEKREKTLETAREEAREIIKEARLTAEDAKKQLKDLDLLDSMAERNARLMESRRRIKEAESKYSEVVQVPENYKPVRVEDLKIGDKVKVLTLGQNGEILSIPDEKGDMMVQVGAIKAKVNLKNIMLVMDGKGTKKSAPKSPTKSKYGSLYKAKSQEVSLSINVRGKNLDDALIETEKYLDDAFMAGLEEVSIIHGRGGGILRRGIQDMLKSNKHVKSYRNGAFNEGGDGVSIVRLVDK